MKVLLFIILPALSVALQKLNQPSKEVTRHQAIKLLPEDEDQNNDSITTAKTSKKRSKRKQKVGRSLSSASPIVNDMSLEFAEIIVREDHDFLPDFADFKPEQDIFSLPVPESLGPKTVSKIYDSDEKSIEKVKLSVTTVRKRVQTTMVKEAELKTELFGVKEELTATVVVVPTVALTTVTLQESSKLIVNNQAAVTKTSNSGWVLFTPGIIPQEKGAPPDKIPSQPSGVYFKSDALPDALQAISNLLDDSPIYVTETMYVTSRMMRTPVPTPTQTEKANMKSTITTSIKTSSYVKKYEKGKKPTSTTVFRINTNLFKPEIPFNIEPNDIYRGLHASSGRSIIASVALLTLSMAATFLLFL